MEELFLTVEQCRHLQALGLDMSNAKMTHVLYLKDNQSIEPNLSTEEIKEFNHDYEFIPTYTLQEVLEKLPIEIDGYLLEPSWDWKSLSYLFLGDEDDWGEELCLHKVDGKNLFDAAYMMLCWCLEKGYIK